MPRIISMGLLFVLCNSTLSGDLYLFCLSRFETVDLTTRLLIPIIVLQNHNRFNIIEKGHNYSIDIAEIEAEVNGLSLFFSCSSLWAKLCYL